MLSLCLDPGDIRSHFYNNSLALFDVSSSAMAFVPTSLATPNPRFLGSYGRLSVAEAFGFNGFGSWTLVGSSPAVLEQFHKDGATGSALAWVRLASNAAQAIMGDVNPGLLTGNVGFSFRTAAGGQLNWFVANSIGIALTAATVATVPTGQWTLLSVMVSENSSPALILGIDETFQSFLTSYSSPSALPATYSFQVGAGGNNVNAISNGGMMGPVVITNTTLTTSEVVAYRRDTMGRLGLSS